MAAPLIAGGFVNKVVLSFIDINGATWSEVYYAPGSTPRLVFGTIYPQLLVRLQSLCQQHMLTHIRVSLVGSPRVTYQRTVNMAGFAATGATGPLPISTAAVIGLQGESSGQRKLWLRGMPAVWQSRSNQNGFSLLAPAGQKAVENFIGALNSVQMGILTLVPARYKYLVTGLAPGVLPGTTIVSFMNGVGVYLYTPGVGDRLLFAGGDLKTLPGLKGSFPVVGVANVGGFNSPIIQYQLPLNQAATLNAGYFTLYQFSGIQIFDPINFLFLYWGEHTTKNPVGPSRGARRARRIRQLA